jgi:5-formyltetrahydrofolate cyclo-ligase
MTMTDKTHFRKAMRALRDGMVPEDRVAASRQIAEHVYAWRKYKEAQIVFLFAAMGSEADTWPLIASAQREGKTVCLPRVHGDKMDAVPYRPGDVLIASRYGAREPAPSVPAIDVGAIDLILAPALAVTPRGDRLGYGGGYYDRFLSDPRLRAHTSALCFFAQIVDSLPTDMYDVVVDFLVHERGVHSCSKEGSY